MAEKAGIATRMKLYFGEVRTEMSKVVWPTKEELKTYSIVVLISTAVIALFLSGWDFILSHIVQVLFVGGGGA
ncbi:MAG: preprotein translocase subunit SecE [Candidatus Sumerlaeia bacterium]|nr:preprotein translocase subunit SecE [Candidatus Sumerlaeia bacterium]